jgi:hypothetical protein
MIAESVPVADVVTCHHVVYNVQDIEPFIWTLHSHASKRVVIELPQAHPLTSMNDLWRHFWQLDRPTQPSPEMLMDVLRELNIDAHVELFDGEHRDLASFEERVELNRIRLCLPQHRDADIAAVMRSAPTPASRKLATVWWDLSQPTL